MCAGAAARFSSVFLLLIFPFCFDSAGPKALNSLDMTPELTGSGHFDFRPSTGVLILSTPRAF
jgi:hypothetical protein